MNAKNTVLGVAVAGLLAGGIWWFTRPVPAPEKPAAPVAAPAAPTPKVEAPTVPHSAAVAAPVAPPVVASAKPVAAVAAPAAGTDPELNAAITTLINDLEAQDANAFVQDFIVPGMMDAARQAAASQMPADATPEMRAQLEQALQQRMPQMIDQISQQMTQRFATDPKAQQGFQKLGAALKQAQATPPQMNAAGDQATYTLESNGDKDVPPALTFTRKDGKWVIDIMSMARAAQAQQ